MIQDIDDDISLIYLKKIMDIDVEVYNTLATSPIIATQEKIIKTFGILEERQRIKSSSSFSFEKEGGSSSSVVEIFNQFYGIDDIGKPPYYISVMEAKRIECSEFMFRAIRATCLTGVNVCSELAEACKKLVEIMLKGVLTGKTEKITLESIKSYESDNYYFNTLKKEILKNAKG